MDAGKPRVLVAVGPRAVPRLRAILSAWSQAAFARDLRELPGALRQGFDLIVIGAHFDGSRGVDTLVEVMRHHPRCPVVCLRAAPFGSRLGAATFDAYSTACLELGADDVLDLLAFPDDDEGNARVRALLQRIMQSAPYRSPAQPRV
jgi:hypothetical protein